jgi:hypothetical protein
MMMNEQEEEVPVILDEIYREGLPPSLEEIVCCMEVIFYQLH